MDGNSTQDNSDWDNCNAKNTIGTSEDYVLRWHIPSLNGNDDYPWLICGEGDESNVISSGSGSCNLNNLDCD